MTETMTRNAYWLSWWHARGLAAFELHSPWWVSGSRDDASSICAAVRAESEDAVREAILASYDERPDRLEFRFVEEMKPGASLFTDRFPRADWMRWDEGAGKAMR